MNNFGLISQVLRGYWLLLPGEVIAANIIVGNLLSSGKAVPSSGKNLSMTSPMAEVVAGSTEGGYDSAQKGSAAIVSMSGTMIKYGAECSYGTVEVADMIRRAADNAKISTIILDAHSGGGAVDAIAPMVDAIKYAQGKGKPVVAWCDMCASAMYWVACHCDRIVAGNDLSAQFGSIGVLCSFADAKPAYEKLGYVFHEIYSDFSGNKNEAFNLALEGKYEMIKNDQLNPLALRFQEVVKASRPNLKQDEPGILSGKMFWAKQALDLGMIDEIGTLSRAVELSREVLNEYIISSYINP